MNKASLDLFVSILLQIGYAIFGIFLVTGVIILLTMILNKVTEKKSR